jgi:hypothetical protein
MDILNVRPISGLAVCSVLENLFVEEQTWIVHDMETLSPGSTLELGRIWSQVQRAPISISTSELCEALRKATQVVSLDLRLAEDEDRALVIEDGELISNHL